MLLGNFRFCKWPNIKQLNVPFIGKAWTNRLNASKLNNKLDLFCN